MKQWSQFEQAIEKTNEYYRRKGFGLVEKIPNGTKTIRKGGKPVTILTDKTGCDFIGHLHGVPVAFDCKSTQNKTSFPLGTFNKPMVKDHQKAFLKDYKKTGGKAFLLIQFNKTHEVYLVDINDYLEIEQAVKVKGRKSIPVAAFAGMEVPQRGYYLDYLEKL